MTHTATGYQVCLYEAWTALPKDWQILSQTAAPTPFQGENFLSAWYATLITPGTRPLLVDVRDHTGVPAMLLPFVLCDEAGLKFIRFADSGVSDNNAPLLGPSVPATKSDMDRAWKAVRAALPAHDIMELEKLPALLGDQPNPLTWLSGVQHSVLSMHPLDLNEDWKAYTRSRTKKFRKEQERVWRVFQRHEGARFDMISDVDLAISLLDTLEQQQSERLRGLGQDYRLDAPQYRAFYRRVMEKGLGSRSIIFGALRVGEELVGGLIGIADCDRIVFVRLSHGGEAWRTCSPGRLVIERVLEWAHGAGYRKIDFSIGDYDYKDDFGIDTVSLYEVTQAGSWRGMARVARAQLKGVARRSNFLRRMRRRFARNPAAKIIAKETAPHEQKRAG